MSVSSARLKSANDAAPAVSAFVVIPVTGDVTWFVVLASLIAELAAAIAVLIAI